MAAAHGERRVSHGASWMMNGFSPASVGLAAVSDTVRVVAEAAPAGASQERIVSGEAVELDVRVARVGSRMLAFLVDFFVQVFLWSLLVTFGVLVAFIAWAGGLGDSALAAGVFTLCILVAFVIYPATLETLTGGRSLGKLVVGLRVVRDDGGPIRFRHALVRVLVGFAADFPGLALPPLTWLASLWTAVVNPHGKRLGDLAAGTIVIHDRSPAAWGWVPPAPPQLASWSATLDLSGLDDELALAVRHYLSRNRELAEPARTRLGYQLASEVAAVITPPAPPGVAGWAYLAAVLGERHRREAARLAERRAITARVWPGLGIAPRPPHHQPASPPQLHLRHYQQPSPR